MSSSLKNLLMILAFVTVAYGAYFLYIQNESTSLDSNTGDLLTENMLSRTQIFIERRQQLETMNPNLSFFEDARFRSLRSYTRPVEDQPVGRTDPFAEVNGTN